MPIDLSDFLSASLQDQQTSNSFQHKSDSLRYRLIIPGVIEFIPTMHSPKRIVLSAGVHGNETAPIEMLNVLIKEIAEGSIKLRHPVLFILGNLSAIQGQTRFVEENLNRLFEPTIDGTTNEIYRAKALMEAVSEFFDVDDSTEKLHYDLHTAIRPSIKQKFAVYPFLHGREYCKEQLAFLSSCDINTVLLSQTPTGTFSYYSSHHHQAHAFTLELGKVMPFGQNNMSDFVRINIKLRELLANDELVLPTFEESPLQLYTVNQNIIKDKADFALNFDDDIPNFTTFRKGDVLASEKGKQYFAEYDGEAIVFPNANVPIGQRAMLTVKPCEI